MTISKIQGKKQNANIFRLSIYKNGVIKRIAKAQNLIYQRVTSREKICKKLYFVFKGVCKWRTCGRV